ncbi:MAG: hypothetical protein AAGU19_01230 [Prolixibacteraceae bacterium]
MRLILFFTILVLSSCSKDSDLFDDYNILNRNGLDLDESSFDVLKLEDDQGYGTYLNYTGLSGLRNNRLWIGIFDNKTHDQIFEYTFVNPLPTKYEFDLGYGEYHRFDIKNYFITGCKASSDNGIVALNMHYSDGTCKGGTGNGFIILKGKEIASPYPVENISSWFENSVLLFPAPNYSFSECEGEGTNNARAWGKDIGSSPHACSANGQLIELNVPDNVRSIFEPISLTDGISFQNRQFKRICFETEVRTIWVSNIDVLNDVPANALITYNILSRSQSKWECEVEVTLYSGQKNKHFLELNIQDGTIKYGSSPN